VSVNLDNRTHLRVTFTNSKLDVLPAADRAAAARAAAEFVRDHYRGYAALQDISVSFARTSGAGPVTYTRKESPYTFTTAQLGSPHDSTDGTTPP
jgi:hypothetical protein